jgi:hypothetical protein
VVLDFPHGKPEGLLRFPTRNPAARADPTLPWSARDEGDTHAAERLPPRVSAADPSTVTAEELLPLSCACDAASDLLGTARSKRGRGDLASGSWTGRCHQFWDGRAYVLRAVAAGQNKPCTSLSARAIGRCSGILWV